MSDYVLFKYKRIDKNLLKSLVNSELYFASPERLNDPFDCRVDIFTSLKNAISMATGSTYRKLDQLLQLNDFLDDLKKNLEKIGVCSFSLELCNILMWSHYADDHRGVCLTYEIPKSFFHQTTKEILGIVEMDYGLNPLSIWFLEEALNFEVFKEYNVDRFAEFGKALTKKALSIKAKEWQYEMEVRILRNDEGVQVIDKNFLKQVCYGLNTSPSDIVLLNNIIRQSGYEVDLCKMEPIPSSDFGFVPKEI